MEPLWRIELLGGLRAVGAERTITRFRSHKTGALLAYLAFHLDTQHPLDLLPVAVPGQEMPGGGTFETLEFANGTFCVSQADSAGQHAFLAGITEGDRSSVGAYLMDATGKLSLIVKNGSATDLGPITRVGGSGGSQGIALNDRGQVALPLRIGGGPTTVAILTPVEPQPAP